MSGCRTDRLEAETRLLIDGSRAPVLRSYFQHAGGNSPQTTFRHGRPEAEHSDSFSGLSLVDEKAKGRPFVTRIPTSQHKKCDPFPLEQNGAIAVVLNRLQQGANPSL